MNLRSNTHAQQPSIVHQQRFEAGFQRGSIAIMAATFLSIMVILLSSIDIGYLFYMKRDLQKMADLAALAGAQQLVSTPLTNTCDAPALAAGANAQTNGFSITVPNTMSNSLAVNCGRWDPTANAALAPSYFSASPANTRLNAVQVILTQNVSAFFGLSSRTISAQAIAATSDPYAAFSVGSTLLQIGNGTATGLLSVLGLNLTGTDLVSYKGLVNISVTPSGLLKALGFQIPLHADIGTVTNILQLNTAGCSNGMCTLQALLGAISTVGGQQDFINALGLTVQQLNLKIPLLSGPNGQGGIFALVNTSDAQSALNANVDVLTLLNTTLAVANNQNFAAVPPSSAISIPGVATVTTQIGIVEPPSIAIGGLPTTPSGPLTTAYTAQVRLYTHINSNLLGLNLVNIDLPIIVDVVNGFGALTDMCTQKINGQDTATITVQDPVLSLCVGGINGVVDDTAVPSTMLKTAFSKQNVCQANLTPWPLLSVLDGTLSVNTKIALNALNTTTPLTLVKGQTKSTANSLQIGTTLNALLSALLSNIPLTVLSTVLSPVLNPLQLVFTGLNGLGDGVSNLLSNFLGIQLGVVDVTLLDLNCGGTSVKLVY